MTKHFKVETQVIEDYSDGMDWTYCKFKGGTTYYVAAPSVATAIALVTRLIYSKVGSVMVGERSAYIETVDHSSVDQIEDPYELSDYEKDQIEHEGRCWSPVNRELTKEMSVAERLARGLRVIERPKV